MRALENSVFKKKSCIGSQVLFHLFRRFSDEEDIVCELGQQNR